MQAPIWQVARAVLVAAVMATVLLFAGVAFAATGSSQTLSLGSNGPAVKELQRKLHVQPTGYYGNETRTAVKHFQKRHRLKADGIAGPATLRALGVRATKASYSTGGSSAPSGSSSGGGSKVKLPAQLQKIAQCESGGNPRAVSPSGKYRGKFQFDQATWEAWGGTGDPIDASESKQDKVALKLYHKRGTAPWPNCA
jgi:peptidoglycan hydrolase-like protein with peptidoglycan-binding domain